MASGRGPKPKPKDQLRRNRITLRLTDEELSIIQSKAGSDKHKRVADYIRRASMNKKLPDRIPEINREAWVRLSRAAANLNQLAKAANEGQAVEIEALSVFLAVFRRRLVEAGEGGHEG